MPSVEGSSPRRPKDQRVWRRSGHTCPSRPGSADVGSTGGRDNPCCVPSGSPESRCSSCMSVPPTSSCPSSTHSSRLSKPTTFQSFTAKNVSFLNFTRRVYVDFHKSHYYKYKTRYLNFYSMFSVITKRITFFKIINETLVIIIFKNIHFSALISFQSSQSTYFHFHSAFF